MSIPTDDTRDLLDKLSTHIKRHTNICISMLDYGARLNTFYYQIALQLPPEGREIIKTELRLYADYLEDMIEIDKLIGDDMQEAGSRNVLQTFQG
jgi:hypothetical protein